MRKLFFLLYALLSQSITAQSLERNLIFNPNLKPFYHGVASGEPTSHSVVLWTRVTPESTGDISVQYTIALDTGFQQIVQTGSAIASESRDYTLKVAVDGLNPNTVYYYYFEALGRHSLIGRAKTCPAGGIEHLRFGVVSCSNYEHGYFSAYGHLALQNDLDAVIHLGDYIYEYEANGAIPGRVHEPSAELLTLSDYRTRYSLHRLDPNLIRLHQQHTMISVWDDHESANDSHTDGAQNHQASEGSWAVRKAISKQVYFEWMPIADNMDLSVYRKFQYGDLCDLLMLDTRLEGREMPPPNFDTPDIPARQIISPTQMNWLTNQLKNSSARWKVLGNQILFSTFNVGFSAGILDGNPDPTNIDSIRQVENAFIDNWESYPTQRNSIIDTLQVRQLDNVVIISGDSHCSWAFDVTKAAVKYPVAASFNLPTPHPFNPATGQGYNKTTGEGSYAVEFGVPSVSSNNFDELVGFTLANQFEAVMAEPIQPFNLDYNPHLKYVDLDRHGYLILDLLPDTAQANYYYIPSPMMDTVAASFGKAAYTLKDANHVFIRDIPSAQKVIQDAPTPLLPFGTVGQTEPETIEILSIFPNPAHDFAYIQIGLNQPQDISVALYDRNGRLLLQHPSTYYSKGLYAYRLPLGNMPKGVYQVVVSGKSGIISKLLVVE
jgi:alkaline phosphatase D